MNSGVWIGRPSQGWICPGCGQVWAPWVPKCSCNGSVKIRGEDSGASGCGCPRDTGGSPIHGLNCPHRKGWSTP